MDNLGDVVVVDFPRRVVAVKIEHVLHNRFLVNKLIASFLIQIIVHLLLLW